MSDGSKITGWKPGTAPIAVIMISLNEGHNMQDVLENLKGWAQEVFLVDSYSRDDTVDTALIYGVHIVQRRFRGFGDQWNFALNELPVTAPWTMKLDPDERLTNELKKNISKAISENSSEGFSFLRRLWFMGKPLPINQEIVRIWKTGQCKFTDVAVNEHPLVDGSISHVKGILEHHDSPDLHHWVEKQNRYTTAEAISRYRNDPFAFTPKLFGTSFERRMWFKKNFVRFPFRYQIQYFMNLLRVQPWKSGYAGIEWARQRVWVWRMREAKFREMQTIGKEIELSKPILGKPHPRVFQSDS
jgi:glycosyltransferase involved in cell wall biosynthesis